MKFDNYISVYFEGNGNHATYQRTKNIYKTILEIFFGSQYNGLGWKVEKISIGSKTYNVNFICKEKEMSINILEIQ